MTLVIGIKCTTVEGDKIIPTVLFASDTQASTSFIKRSATKLQFCIGRSSEKEDSEQKDEKNWKMVVASSGDAFVASEAIRAIQQLLFSKIPADTECPSIAIYVQLNAIGNAAYDVYKKYKDRGEDPQFEILLGAADTYSALYQITCFGKTYEVEDYAIIGSGAITGGELLVKELLDKNPSEEDAAALAALLVSEVSLVDMYVGGEPKILVAGKRSVWEYKETVYKEICEKSRTKWNLLKEAWRKMQQNDRLQEKITEVVSKT